MKADRPMTMREFLWFLRRRRNWRLDSTEDGIVRTVDGGGEYCPWLVVFTDAGRRPQRVGKFSKHDIFKAADHRRSSLPPRLRKLRTALLRACRLREPRVAR